MPTWNIQSNILVWLSQDDPLPPAVESFDYISIHREFRWTRPAAQWIELVSRCRRDMVNMKPSCLYLRLEEMHEWVKWVENPKNKARQFAIYWLIHTQICRTDYWARVILRRFPLDIALLIMSYHFRSGPCRGPTVVHSLQDYMDAWLIDPSVENTYRLEHFRGIDWRIDPRRHRNIEFRRPIYPTLNLHRWEPPRVLDHLFGWIGRKITIEGVDAWDMSRVESAVSAFEDVMFAEHVSLRKWQFSALRNGTRMFYESNVRKYSHWTFPVLEESTNMFFRSPRAPARGLSQ